MVIELMMKDGEVRNIYLPLESDDKPNPDKLREYLFNYLDYFDDVISFKVVD